MEDRADLNTLLERIASALERIADSLAARPASEIRPENGRQPAAEVEVTGSEPDELPNDITLLQEFLCSRGITIKRIPPEQESDETLDRMSVFIGSKFESVRVLLELIKANMNSGRSFSLSLKDESQQTIAHTTNLCTNLYNIAFLTAYRYQKSPVYQLYATPSTSPRALNFYSGEWLERFVKTQVIALLKARLLHFSYLCNSQITLPNGDDFELDMLFEAGGEIFWLEAKTGDYRKHIEKYSRMSRMMGLDRSHTFMILADGSVTENIARDLGNLFGMTVVRIERFAEQLALILPDPSATESVPGNGALPLPHAEA